MIRKFFRAAAAASAMLLLAGCTIIRESPAEDAGAQRDTPEYELASGMLYAFIRDDAAGFIRRMAPKNPTLLNEEQFHKFRREMVESRGEPVGFRYLATLEMPVPFKPHIWAVRMKKTNPQTGKEFHQEILFRVVTGRADGKVYVISVNFL